MSVSGGALTTRRGQWKQREALLKTSAVALLFGVTGETVLEWVKAGVLPATQTPGGQYRFEPADVDALMYPEAATEAARV